MTSFKPTTPLPAGTALEIAVTILAPDGSETFGTLELGAAGELKDFERTAIATQRGVYELLLAVWTNWEHKQQRNKYEH